MRANEFSMAVLEDNQVEIKEGATKLYVPKSSLGVKVPPRVPVFFNIFAELNRNISMGVYRVFAAEKENRVTFADCFAATGVRGIRAAVEVPKLEKVHLNDVNPVAIDLAKRNASLNSVSEKCEFSSKDICFFLAEQVSLRNRFSIIDLDPYGSPAAYVDCALRSLKDDGLLSVTATDTAVLCGVYPKVAYRKYYCHTLRTEYCHEMGVRMILGAIAHNAQRLELGIFPMFSHVNRHYFRVYTVISASSECIEKTYTSINFIKHCTICNYRDIGDMNEIKCKNCGIPLKNIGPLWVGNIHEKKFLINLIEDFKRSSFKTGLKISTMALEEADMPPAYYNVDNISSKLNVATPSISLIIESLRDSGYLASRTAFNFKGIKTNAPISIITEIVRQLNPT